MYHINIGDIDLENFLSRNFEDMNVLHPILSNGFLAKKLIVAQFVEPSSSLFENGNCITLVIERKVGPRCDPKPPSMPDSPTR
jgi:hypothetical protein